MKSSDFYSMVDAFETPKSDYKLTVDRRSSTMIRESKYKTTANVFMTVQKKILPIAFLMEQVSHHQKLMHDIIVI